MPVNGISSAFFFCHNPHQGSLPLPSSIPLFHDFFQPPLKSDMSSLAFATGFQPQCSSSPSTPCWSCISFLGYTLTVQFSNGKLQNPGNMRFTLYNSTDLVNPRQRSHRILVSACWCSTDCLGSADLRRFLVWADMGGPEERKEGVANGTLAPLRSKILGELMASHLYGFYLSRQGFFM